MMKLVPGAEVVVGAMGLLFEAGKLASFAMLHRRSVPRLIRVALAGVGVTLMAANVAGVSGFLSNAYERVRQPHRAAVASAESNLAEARTALIKARDDRGRQRAAQAVVTSATAERDALVQKLSAARGIEAQVEGTERSGPPES